MRSRVFLLFLAVLLAVYSSFSPASNAQAVYGSILGTATDAQGNAVAGAKVTVTSIAKGSVEETTTNEDGNYTVSHLIPDLYNVRVEATGFKVYEVKGVQVSADVGAKVDAKMDVGSVSQSIEVTGEIPQLGTDIETADVVLAPNPRLIELQPDVERYWGKEIVFRNVPLRRMDVTGP